MIVVSFTTPMRRDAKRLWLQDRLDGRVCEAIGCGETDVRYLRFVDLEGKSPHVLAYENRKWATIKESAERSVVLCLFHRIELKKINMRKDRNE